MEGISVDGRNGKLIQSLAEMIVRFHGDVFPKLAVGKQRLKADPQILDTLEREVQQEFSRGAGLVVAGLIAVVMQTKEFAAAAERVRQNYSVPLAKGRERIMNCGTVFNVIATIVIEFARNRHRNSVTRRWAVFRQVRTSFFWFLDNRRKSLTGIR